MPSGEHIHTGPVMFIYSGMAAIIMIQLLRLIAAKLVTAGHDRAGAIIGGIVTFS